MCDELTNIELCLYDGGDCCLEGKDTTLCQNCSCMLLVKSDDLQEDFETFDIQPFEYATDFFKVIGNWTVEVEEVLSGPVCAVLCLDHEKHDQINAWHYDKENLFCTCGWVESSKCPEYLVRTNWTLMALDLTREEDSFVQLGKTVPCGKYSFVPDYSLIY